MPKNNFTFSKDYLDSIANAWIFSYQENQFIIQPDELLFGIYKFTKNHKFHAIFWSFFGLKDEAIIESYIQQRYEDTWKNISFKDVKFQLDSSFKSGFDEFSSMWVSRLNVLSLLYMVLAKISDQLFAYLESHDMTIDIARKKVLHILKLTDKAWISPVKFFDMFFNMTKELGISQLDGDTVIDIEKMMLVDWNTWEILLSDDSAIKDRNGDFSFHNDQDLKKEDQEVLTIEYFGIDLTAEVKKWKIDPVIWRDQEIQQLIYTLLRKTKNNPLLLWEAWVGKTAIVEWLAQKIILAEVPERLIGKRIFVVDIWSLIAGTKYRWEFEARFKAIIEEATDPQNNIIMFIDEIHTIIGAGSAEWTSDAANMLKPMLARGKLQLIGATTYDEYQKYIEKDPALKRRFQELMVQEPSRQDAITILQWIKNKFEDYHGVMIEDNAIVSAVDYSIRYIMNKFLPDKAIDLMDEAAARVSTLHNKLSENKEYELTVKKIETIKKKIEKSILKQDYFAAAWLKEQEEELKQKLSTLRSYNNLPYHLRPHVNVENIWMVLSDKLWIPANQITATDIARLSKLETQLKSKIFGQDVAVDAVVKAIKRSRISVIESKKPIASFLFLWPTGVGKTYLAKLIASEFFSDEKAMIRVDMSEYMEKYSTSKLIWSAPGYVWYEEWWLLTEQVRRKPYSVILFDEVEKASPDVLNILLQILDEGHLKDNKGRWIDFKNTIIIMTSNIWSDYFGEKMTSLWFWLWQSDHKAQNTFENIQEKVLEEVKEYLAPELINRLSGQIIFNPLSKELMMNIFEKELSLFLGQWKEKSSLTLPKFNKKKITEIIDTIYNPQYWARPIYRYIHDEIEPILIDAAIAHEMNK